MPEKIKSLHLKRFRKFKDNTFAAADRNVLVGANNSGKTSILAALRLFFFCLTEEFSGPATKIVFHKRYINVGEILPIADAVELWTDRQKGNNKATGIIIEIEFESGLKIDAVFTYRFGQVHVDADVAANPGRLSGEGVNAAIRHRVAFIPGLVGILPQEAYVTPARRSAMSIEARYSEMYRSSLLHLNETDKKALKAINKVLSKHLGIEISSIRFDPEKDVYVDIRYSQNGIDLDLANSGSGMLQVIQLLVYIHLHKPSLLLIDEPDAHLHPELQERLGNILKTISQEMNAQLFVATHSPDVIDAFASDEVFFINHEKKQLAAFRKDNQFVSGLIEAGIITNSAISRIAVRPRCLVVEDSNTSTLQRIDEVLNTKLLTSASDFKRAEGVSKFQTIHEVYRTVQDVVGKKITMYFIQDRDGLPDRFIDYILAKYKADGLDVHILERHEIENYLLDGKILRAALKDKGTDVSLKRCRELLVEAATSIKSLVRGDIRRKAIQVNRFCGKPDNLSDATVEAEVDTWFDGLTLNEATVLKVFPGKELLRVVRNLVTSEFAVDIRESDLRGAVTRSRLATDLISVLEEIAAERGNAA